ncbi:pancreatic lipase-related protein 2-like [Crassostrea virginica]
MAALSLLLGCILFAAAHYAVGQRRNTVCYARLGCFSLEYPFNNTDVLPMEPAFINTRFYLFTNPQETPSIISEGDITNSLEHSLKFRPELETVIIVHGFLQNGQVDWMAKMAIELLKRKQQNVILVDWGNGAGFPYSQATANTRVVGAEIAVFVSSLNHVLGTSNAKYHLIGHSLGAHIAGYAGSRLPGLRRITGLDPAQPNYQNFDIQVRLDQDDADFVDAIHTDGSDYDTISGYGMMLPVGHIDFYPNGGKDQPGCPRQSFMNIITEEYEDGTSETGNIISCSHSRSILLFTESINSPCAFRSFQCSNTREFLAGRCFGCGSLPCPTAGYSSIQYRARGKFYLATRSNTPFCGQQYLIRLKFGRFAYPTYGTLKLKFLTTNGISDPVVFSGLQRPFASGQSRNAMLVELDHLGDIVQTQLEFHEQRSFFSWDRSSGIAIEKVSFTKTETNKSFYFCGNGLRMTSNSHAGLHHRQFSSQC